MHFSKLLVAAVASAIVSAAPSGSPSEDLMEEGTGAVAAYPLCPENYDTYCCGLLFPSTTRCRGRKCEHGQAWSCVMGVGKVNSIRTCLEEHENKSAFCKRPGAEHFASALEWEGDHFAPMIEPSMYRQYLKPGMSKPWVPSADEISWDDATPVEGVEDVAGDDVDNEIGELRLV